MPSINQAFAHYCSELLGSAGPCVARRMFGGWGISIDGLTIAIVADLGHGEILWLKADDDNRATFERAVCQRFTYMAKGEAKSMGYYSAPNEAMESPAQMADWARLALGSALKAAQAKALKTGRANAQRARRTAPIARRPAAAPAKAKAERKSPKA